VLASVDVAIPVVVFVSVIEEKSGVFVSMLPIIKMALKLE